MFFNRRNFVQNHGFNKILRNPLRATLSGLNSAKVICARYEAVSQQQAIYAATQNTATTASYSSILVLALRSSDVS